MGKTNNNREIASSPERRHAGVVNLSRLRTAVPKINLDRHQALQNGRKKFTAESGTVAELLADPLWGDVFPQGNEAGDFSARLEKVLNPDLSSAEVAAIVQALSPNLDYQQLVRKTSGKRLEHFRHLLAYPNPGAREFPLDLKKPLIDAFTALITNLQYNSEPEPAIAEELTNRLENIDFQIDELRRQDPHARQSSLALQQLTLVANLYHFLAATEGSYSQYHEQHGALADLVALEIAQEDLLDRPPQAGHSEQEIIAAWQQAEYQGLLAVLSGGEEQ